MHSSNAKAHAQELLIRSSSYDRTLYFHGTSMEPFLQEGDQLVIQPVEWETIRPGDIITYRFEDKYPTRRVIRKQGDCLVFRCDGWPDRLFETTREDVLGRVIARMRGGQWLERTDPAWQAATRRALIANPWRGLLRKAARLARRGKEVLSWK